MTATQQRNPGSLAVARAARRVPALLWTADGSDPAPLVLVGHGGGGHKADGFVAGLAERLLARGLSVLSIDAPFHGEREPRADGEAFFAAVRRWGPASAKREMTGDWLAAVDAAARAGVSTARLGYVGVSLGTSFGLPVCSALGDRLRCAVLGQCGLEVRDGYPAEAGLDPMDRSALGALGAPVLFHVQWDDEIFTRERQLETFDLIGSPDKLLLARPGRHGAQHTSDEDHWADFMARHLVR